MNWEDGIEALLECLDLHLDGFMECVMQNKVDILLAVFDCHFRVQALVYELNIVAWQRKVELVVFDSVSSIRHGQAL